MSRSTNGKSKVPFNNNKKCHKQRKKLSSDQEEIQIIMDRHQLYFALLKVACLSFLFGFGIYLVRHKPYQRGFFCDDETIKLPFKYPDTVTFTDLLLLVLPFPFVVIVLSEFVYYFISLRKLPFQDHIWWSNTLQVLSVWFLATTVSFIVEGFTKMMVGRLRPIFLDVCRPQIDCNDPKNVGRYITDFQCTVEKPRYPLDDLRRSFPSGHSAESMMAMLFLIIYLHKRYNAKECIRYPLICLQLCLFLITIFTGLSRIQDHKHHWTDVLAGFSLGASMASIIVYVTGGLNDLTPYDNQKAQKVINEDEIRIKEMNRVCINT
ncbi:phospholipid phosphatase 1-like isoform X2 [Brevipalpus obovatus]|uniref:phospholipid phosphatase 1-like isoform X2 n=1 Tax=Brevipalpus obovatus TaxID=246614 RepID=UPI003D9DDAA7